LPIVQEVWSAISLVLGCCNEGGIGIVSRCHWNERA
jgi:hypothetical protein